MISKGYISKLDEPMPILQNKGITTCQQATEGHKYNHQEPVLCKGCQSCSKSQRYHHTVFPCPPSPNSAELYLLTPFTSICSYITCFLGFTMKLHKQTNTGRIIALELLAFPYFPFSQGGTKGQMQAEVWQSRHCAGSKARTGTQ